MSPASVDQCHGARTRLGPRGGGRLHVLSAIAVTPTSIVCCTGAPGLSARQLASDSCALSARRIDSTGEWRDTSADANHRERCDVLRGWKLLISYSPVPVVPEFDRAC